jgi:enoyl-CoA hydratase/carnithine racemase
LILRKEEKQTMSIPDYFTRYENLKMSRDADGVLIVQMHTKGGPIVFSGKSHSDFVDAFNDISKDRGNSVIILTGTGDEWMARIDFQSLGDITNPRIWDQIYWEGKKVLMNLLDIEVPLIAAINGPALLHSEYALLCDIVLASENAVFQDMPHLSGGIVPGDGMHVVWPLVLGEMRGRYFLWTQQKLSAREAHAMGVVAEVLSRDHLLPRARELASQIAKLPPLTRRYTRAALTQRMKRLILEGVGYGLALEGITATDLRAQKPS